MRYSIFLQVVLNKCWSELGEELEGKGHVLQVKDGLVLMLVSDGRNDFTKEQRILREH
jgi:hypothetical protein